jgi:SAM-dependent methyltransferase
MTKKIQDSGTTEYILPRIKIKLSASTEVKRVIDLNRVCSGLQLRENGIWYATKKAEISYPEEGYETCFEVEDNSFWFKHRNRCILSLIQQYPPEDNGPIFDIGGGNGYVSREISKSGFDVVLVEPGIDGVRNAKKRGVDQIICSSFEDAKFLPKSLHAVGLFDVIEHIENDLSFLKAINPLLKRGGKLYITVPAYSFLWSNEDVLAGHNRRYTNKTLSEKLNVTGFSVNFCTYIFRPLPLLIFLLRTIPYIMGITKETINKAHVSREHAAKNKMFGQFLDVVLSPEIRNIHQNSPMSFGGSCLLVATNSYQ